LGFKPTRTIDNEVCYGIESLIGRKKDLEPLRKNVTPKILW